MSQPLRILVVDDHPATRSSLNAAIAADPRLTLTGEAATWAEAYRLAIDLRPDVMVLDLNLPDGNGWHLLEQLAAARRRPPTLVLSICDEAIYARRLFRSGARGYLMKDEPLERIVQGIVDVAAGHLVASQPLTTQLMHEALQAADPPAEPEHSEDIAGLSDRELQLFSLFALGQRNKDVAAQLRISEKTVATYKARVMRKLGVSNTPELIARYRAGGLG